MKLKKGVREVDFDFEPSRETIRAVIKCDKCGNLIEVNFGMKEK